MLTATDFTGGPLSLDNKDQLLVYQGTQADPTFLCALDWSGNAWKTSDSFWGTDDSGLPKGLTSGENALLTDDWVFSYYKNWAYKGTDTGRISTLRTAIGQYSNWQKW